MKILYNDNKIKTNLTSKNCPNLFYSKANALGSLNSFKFFSQNEEENSTMLNFFNTIVEDKTITFIEKYNLIHIDADYIFTKLSDRFKKLTLNKLIEDYFIEKRDDYYLTELISAVREDLNMKKLKKKVIATKDKKFINKVKSTLKAYEIEF